MIEGIGGVIILTNDVKRLADWYREYLGLNASGEDDECKSVYATFDVRDDKNPDNKITMAWAIMHTDKNIKDQPRTGYLNYRVKNMTAVLENLRAKGVVIEKTAEYPYGKFASIKDIDGNPVELWESAD